MESKESQLSFMFTAKSDNTVQNRKKKHYHSTSLNIRCLTLNKAPINFYSLLVVKEKIGKIVQTLPIYT